MWFRFGEVSSSSGCLGWATLFYCGTPWAFHIIIGTVPNAFFSDFFMAPTETVQNAWISLHVILTILVVIALKSNRKAMNRNWSNQKANPALKTKTGSDKYYK